ncbi:MAG: sulfatase [Candidatus Sumerlaeia bacterium]
MPARPNILYIITHDTGRFLGCYDRPIPFSPNLDRFAEEGIKFTSTFCTATCCGPSRVCAMTGKYSHVTGTLGLAGMGWSLPAEEKTLVDYLNAADYETIHMGFCHERWYGAMNYQVDGSLEDEKYWKDDTKIVIDNAIDYLENRDDDRPFYMNLAMHETHASKLAQFLERYQEMAPPDQCWVPPTEPDMPAFRERFSKWYASLRYADEHIGRMLNYMKQSGLWDNTVIMYTTDHGVGCVRGKGNVYEVGMEIAHLMHLPKGMQNGYVVDHLIPNIDFMPTLMEAAGLTPPDGVNGRSFWPLLKGDGYTPRGHVFLERNFHGERASKESTEFVDKYDPQRTIRTERYRYVRNFRPDARPRLPYRHEITGYSKVEGREGNLETTVTEARPAEELYDRLHDPWEQNNLIGRPEYADIQSDLSAKLLQWMEETNDPALKPGLPEPLQEPARWPTSDKIQPVEHV